MNTVSALYPVPYKSVEGGRTSRLLSVLVYNKLSLACIEGFQKYAISSIKELI